MEAKANPNLQGSKGGLSPLHLAIDSTSQAAFKHAEVRGREREDESERNEERRD